MRKLSWKAKSYIIMTILAGLALMVWQLANMSWEEPWMLFTLSVLASLTLIIKVEGTTNRTHYNISFVIYSFTFILYGPGAAILVIVLSNLAEWAWHKYPWYIQCFNISVYIVAISLTGLLSHWLNPEQTQLDFPGIVSALAAVALFTLINHLMVGIVVWLARGENFAQSGIFDSLPLVIDFTLLSMGICAAMLWTLSPFAVVLVLLPLYLIYSTLRLPALERQTALDPKTGLYNVKYFEQELENELKRANRFDRPLTVVMGDLDLLRNINNTYGHLAGDQVLIGIANILKEHTREYDKVCRFGGEEFAILIPESTPNQVLSHIESIRASISTAEFTVPTSVTPIKASMSFGIASRESFSQTATDIIHDADIALYHAKLNGRNQTIIYNQEAYNGIFQGDSSKAPEPWQVSSSEHIQPRINLPLANPIQKTGGMIQEERKLEESAPEAVSLPKKESNMKVNLFVAGLAGCTLVMLFLTGLQVKQVDLIGLGIFAGILVLTEWFSIDIYVRDTSVSTSTVPILASVLLFGLPAAVLCSLIFATITMLKHRIILSRFIFNASNQLLGCLLIINLIFLTGVTFTQLSLGLQVLVSLLSSGVIYLSTTIMISIAIALDTGQVFKEIWKEKFSWLAPSFLAMGLISLSLIFSYQMEGVIGVLIMMIPLYLLRLSQIQYIERTKGIVSELRDKNKILENNTREINSLNEGLLETLAEVIDHRDPYVLEHSKKVSQYAVGIAKQMRLHPKQVELIRKASLMHDVGKLGIREAILLKPGSLTNSEFDMIKLHPMIGVDILETTRTMLRFVPIVRHHHERYDGNGYPDGLQGQNIPIEARIVALADAIEAMSSDRPYRQALSMERIIEEIQTNTGKQFDPQVVEAFMKYIQMENNQMKISQDIDHQRENIQLNGLIERFNPTG
jgi:diguanylate cyclase (GGDEF)-like protein/putative nucleotidyltransferase with HDIG domain